MAKRFFFLSVCFCLTLFAEEWDSFEHFPSMEVPYHPVTTTSKEAQKAFDKGLVALFAFNYDEAIRSFDSACLTDSSMAMAYWGLALALDQNLERTSPSIRVRLTVSLSQKALEFSENCTPNEKAYIQALAKRFSSDTTIDRHHLREAYAEAMKSVCEAFPDDLDAATLYAESKMDLLYWHFWKKDKTPEEGTLAIVDILESVLKRNPYHLGANHYNIHVLENSPYPERALMSAYRLDSLNLADWGHLIHTTSHIYLRVGQYDLAVKANKKAVQADKSYIKIHGIEGRYPLKYLAHNYYYLTFSYLWQERYKEAIKTARNLEQLVHPHIADVEYLEYNLYMPLEVYLYFHRWEEILAYPEPEKSLKMTHLYWLFARAMAYFSLTQKEKGEEAQEIFLHEKADLFERQNGGNAFSYKFFEVAENILESVAETAKGELEKSIPLLEKALSLQQDLGDLIWYAQIEQTLGAMLLKLKRFDTAETFFREALRKFPLNGRSLFGLSQALQLQGKDYYSIERECREALKFSESSLTINDL